MALANQERVLQIARMIANLPGQTVLLQVSVTNQLASQAFALLLAVLPIHVLLENLATRAFAKSLNVILILNVREETFA